MQVSGFEAMSSKCKYLPPNIQGEISSVLDLTFKISWRARKFNRVKLKLCWWGEDDTIKDFCKEDGTSYKIVTSDSLWLLYLKHAAPYPLTIQVYSAKTLNFIGTAKVFLNSSKKDFAIVCDLKSERSFKLGEIAVHFTLRPFKKMKPPIMPVFIDADAEKENFRIIEKEARKPSLKSCVRSSSGASAYLKESSRSFTRISIIEITFEPSARQKIQQLISQHRLEKFIFKMCAMASNSSAGQFTSTAITTVPNKVGFVRKVDLTIEGDSKINFGLCIKSAEKATPPVFIGFSSLQIKSQASNEQSGVSYKTASISNEKGIVGSLLLKIEMIRGHSTGRIKKTSNDQCEPGKTHESKSLQTDGLSSVQPSENNTAGSRTNENENDHRNRVEVRTNPDALMTHKGFQGMLSIEEIRNVKNNQAAEYFITYDCFWNSSQEATGTTTGANGLLNYLKQFTLICDDQFLNQVLNNHVELKLWEKTEHSEKMVGNTLIPLHQFFIAFRDSAMIDHLSRNPLPVISFDNWANFVTPTTNGVFCQGKILLAIGSESQIDYLKMLKSLEKTTKLPHHATSAPAADEDCNQESASDSQSWMKNNKLSAFIESLSRKLPENENQASSSTHTLLPTHPKTSDTKKLPQFGKTSELLDSLQKALMEPPPLPTVRPAMETSTDSSLSPKKIRVRVTIDSACHLQKLTKKRQNRRKVKGSPVMQKIEFEPAAYATFESVIGEVNESSLPKNIVKSHEGLVNCTKVMRGCEPEWNEVFDVLLLLDMFTNPQKQFIVKVWRKVAPDSEMKPTPFVDAVIGFCAIDLNVLMTGLKILSGYYNIIDFSGKVNGQIKISLTPQESLARCQNLIFPDIPSYLIATDDNEPNLLSRTLKRKFTELDEITQRLKARLQDVTSEENFGSEDEFERDLRYCAEVDTFDTTSYTQDFAWLGEAQKVCPTAMPGPSTSSQALDSLLKKYDLDTIINPHIFKNVINPSLANSDSTPTLDQRTGFAEGSACAESGDTSLSEQELPIDPLLQMQSALQKATLDDTGDLSSRKDPDGNISEE